MHVNSFIYIMIAENGLLKIGKSRNPKRRLLDLQPGSPVIITLHKVFCVAYREVSQIETLVHKRLKSSKRHVRGEWFDATIEEAVSCITAVMEMKPEVRIEELVYVPPVISGKNHRVTEKRDIEREIKDGYVMFEMCGTLFLFETITKT